MWTPPDLPIEVSRKGSTSIGLKIIHAVEREPVNITGEVINCRVSYALGEPIITSASVTIADALAGELDIVFNGASFSSVSGEQEIVILVYELKNQNGSVIVRGPLYLIPGI